MFGRLLRVTGTVLVVAVAFVTPVLATATATPAGADTVVNGCTIVANPTPTNFTNCPGADLSGANLSGVDLSFANLAGAIFVFTTMNGVDLSNANLSSTNLIGSDMSNANLSSANLTGALLVECGDVGGGVHCFVAALAGANLTGATLNNAGLAACNFSPFPFPSTGCGGADLSGADLSGANFTGATLGACLSEVCGGATLTRTLLVPSDQAVTAASSAGAVVAWPTPQSLPGATPGSCTTPSASTFPIGTTTVTCQVFDDHGDVATGTFTVTVNPVHTATDLSSSTNPSMVGQQVNFTATVSPIPTGGTVSFTHNGSPVAGCSAVPLSGASASCSATAGTTGAHNIVATYSGLGAFVGSTSPSLTDVVTKVPCNALAGCNLSGLNLSAASLAGADLQGANLIRANLTGANLTGANLTGANLNSADLVGANLSGASVTADTNFNNVTWGNTTCPDGTNSDNDGGTCVGHV